MNIIIRALQESDLPHIDQLFATKGKLIDYRQMLRSFFITSADTVNDVMHCYALAHKIHIICNSLPPVEYMLNCVNKNVPIARRLQHLQIRMNDGIEPNKILIEWKNEYMRFRDEGYQ